MLHISANSPLNFQGLMAPFKPIRQRTKHLSSIIGNIQHYRSCKRPQLISPIDDCFQEYLQVMGFSQFQLRLSPLLANFLYHVPVIAAGMLLMHLKFYDRSFTYEHVSPFLMSGFLVVSGINFSLFVHFLQFFSKDGKCQ